jgi:hypothetical protein
MEGRVMEAAGVCLRCGQPYEPGDTVCYSCGAPIGETQTPTQPVRAVRRPPPEPEEPIAPAPATTPTVAAQPSLPAVVATASLPMPAARAATQRRVWPRVLLLCVVVLAALGGVAYAIQKLTAAPPVASSALYQDAGHRFRFQRPALWTLAASDAGVTLTDSDGVSTARVLVAAPAAGEDAAAHADALAKPIGLQAAPTRDFAGETWQQRTGQVAGADGVVRQDVILVAARDGTLYTIEFSSPVATFTSLDNLVFQPLLDSFAFA